MDSQNPLIRQRRNVCGQVIDGHRQKDRQVINDQVNKGNQILRMNNKYGHNPYIQ
jgi:hypothetical protein